jgi:hypothetical protein
MLKMIRLASVASLVLAIVVLGTGAAAAAEAHHGHSNTCTGTLTAPGVLAGTFHGNVVITGVCAVNGGAAVIQGSLILAPGSVLNAQFAHNDVTGSGTSSLTVRGDVRVQNGATLAMGCEPNFNPCLDDPNGTGQNRVSGDVQADQALGVLLHRSKIGGNVSLRGGGGGVTCAIPSSGIFGFIGSPVFSDAEDNNIGGSLTIVQLQTCWMGALRNHVQGNIFTAHNTMADPDANEVLANHVRGNIACFNNSPATQYGDSMSSPNRVQGRASGECSFNARKPNPAPSGPLAPISVKV